MSSGARATDLVNPIQAPERNEVSQNLKFIDGLTAKQAGCYLAPLRSVVRRKKCLGTSTMTTRRATESEGPGRHRKKDRRGVSGGGVPMRG